MFKVLTQGVEGDVIVRVKKLCNFVNFAMLSSKRNRLEAKAASQVSELLETLSEIQDETNKLSVEMSDAKKRSGVNYGESKPWLMSKKALLDWVGETPSDRNFSRPDQSWKSHINPKTLMQYGLNPNQTSQGSLKGKGASLLSNAGPSGTTVYTRDHLAKHAVHLAAERGADGVMGYKEEKGKGGDSHGNSDKAVKKRIREQHPFETSDYSHDRGAYEKWVNREYNENRNNYLEGE